MRHDKYTVVVFKRNPKWNEIILIIYRYTSHNSLYKHYKYSININYIDRHSYGVSNKTPNFFRIFKEICTPPNYQIQYESS